MVEEILFWKFNIRKLDNKPLQRHEISHLFIYSAASTKSSTWRELEPISYTLDSMKNSLRNKHIKWHTDNYSSNIIAN